MIGQSTANLHLGARRWIQSLWGVADIHTRQKWTALYPYLSQLNDDQICLLDAGCGYGNWSLELASLHPSWMITGVDINSLPIQYAEESRQKLALNNLSFQQSDFEKFDPPNCYDVVLSVFSAHYMVETGKGDLLFTQFYNWLKPGGILLLLLPRSKQEFPTTLPFLPFLQKHTVFSEILIKEICQTHSLQVELIEPYVGKYGAIAKQIAQVNIPWCRMLSYSLQLIFDFFDQYACLSLASTSWLVIARKLSK